MINLLLSLFKHDPIKKVLKERDNLYKRAVQLQRDGDLRSYAEVMTRIGDLEKEYERLAGEKERG